MAVFNAISKDATYNGTNGVIDTVNYASLNANITPNHDGILVDLGAGLAQYTSFGTRLDDLNSIENIFGSELDDELRGSVGTRNVLNGFDGDDLIDGKSGDDLLIGGNGDDELLGGDDDDSLQGDAGNDELRGGDDNDTLDGGAGNDLLFGDFGDDIFLGGAGGDEHVGGFGIDTVSYAASSGRVAVNLDQGRGFDGDAAGDEYASIENAIGTAFDDNLIGSGGSNVLDGGGGNDVIGGGAGDDTIIGGTGSDTATFFLATLIDLAAGTATGDGNDILVGIENARATQFGDTVRGSTAANFLEGEAGDDLLLGRQGDDVLAGGSDNDRLEGGGSADRLFGEDGNDRLAGGADDDDLFGGLGADQLAGNAGDDGHFGGAGNDAYTVLAGQGDDFVFDAAGRKDKLVVGSLADIDASTRIGDDLVIVFEGGGSVLIQGHFAGNAVEFLDPLDGDAVVLAEGTTGGGAPGIISGTKRDDVLAGRGGDDLLYGAGGDDRLEGGSGDDLLAGGREVDVLVGGAGADTLRFARGEGTDFIDGFRSGADTIAFDGASFGLAADATVADVVRIGGAAPISGRAFHVFDGAIAFDADWSDAAGRKTIAFFSAGADVPDLGDFALV